jgi:hypothetical protein
MIEVLNALPKGYKLDSAPYDGGHCMIYTIRCRTYKGIAHLFMVKINNADLFGAPVRMCLKVLKKGVCNIHG